MPIEIRELVIKAVIEESRQAGASAGQSNSTGSSGAESQEELVNFCVSKVLEVLRSKNER